MNPVYKSKPCRQTCLRTDGASAYVPAAILHNAEQLKVTCSLFSFLVSLKAERERERKRVLQSLEQRETKL